MRSRRERFSCARASTTLGSSVVVLLSPSVPVAARNGMAKPSGIGTAAVFFSAVSCGAADTGSGGSSSNEESPKHRRKLAVVR